jgi:hypothetical protein
MPVARLSHVERAAIALETLDTVQSIHYRAPRIKALAREIVRRELLDLAIATSMRDLNESIEDAKTFLEKAPHP